MMLRRYRPWHAIMVIISAASAILPCRSTLSDEHATSSLKSTGKPPNIALILTDAQGWGDLSLHGNVDVSTPHIDSLARDGAEVENFYVCAACSPTRAEFLTGRYHSRMGVYSTSAGGERISAYEQTIGDVFQHAGYATAAYGKWHSGTQYLYHPNARGFDDYYGFCSGHWGNYFLPMLEHNGQIVQGNGFIVDDLTKHAIDFISTKERENNNWRISEVGHASSRSFSDSQAGKPDVLIVPAFLTEKSRFLSTCL